MASRRKEQKPPPAPPHPVTQYALDVIAQRIPAGRWVRLACARHLKDLADGAARGLRFSPAHADHAIGFFSQLKHSKGKWAKTFVILEPWQKFIIGSMFGWLRANGTRRFRLVYIEVPRKNGKSTIGAGIGLYLLVADEEPGAEVYSAATKRDQAKLVFAEAKRMVNGAPALKKRISVKENSLTYTAENSFFIPLGADADSMDGLNVHGAIVDELHQHKKRDTFDALDTATGAREQPLIAVITTAGSDPTTICGEMNDLAHQILEAVEGIRRDVEDAEAAGAADAEAFVLDDETFVYVATCDPEDDWTTEEAWRKANPNYGVSVNPDDLARKCRVAQLVPAEQNNFKRKHLDIWTETVDLWLPMEHWDACARECGKIDLGALENSPCYGAFDLSTKLDMTAWVKVWAPDETMGRPWWAVVPKFYLPRGTLGEKNKIERRMLDNWISQGLITLTDGTMIDYGFIERDIIEDANRFDMQEIGFDPWNASGLNTSLEGEGLRLVQVRQGPQSMGDATKNFEGLVVSHLLNHGGHPVLRNQAAGVSLRTDSNENPMPDKSKSRRRIDGIVATIIALSRAYVSVEQGPSVYETRGIRMI